MAYNMTIVSLLQQPLRLLLEQPSAVLVPGNNTISSDVWSAATANSAGQGGDSVIRRFVNAGMIIVATP